MSRYKPSKYCLFSLALSTIATNALAQDNPGDAPAESTAPSPEEPPEDRVDPAPVPEPPPSTETAPTPEPPEGRVDPADVPEPPPSAETAPTPEPPVGLLAAPANETGPVMPPPFVMPQSDWQGVQLGMFGDFGVEFTENFEKSQLLLGQLVLHATADLKSGFSTFTEITFDSSTTPLASVRRLLFHWERNDYFKFSVGRYHLPLTWWNTFAHHGIWLQTTATRPRMLEYENSFVPNHAMGIFASGQLPVLEPLGIRYNIAFSGGGDDHSHEMTTTTDATEMDHSTTSDETATSITPTFNGLIAFEPPRFSFLRIGFSGLIGKDVTANLDGLTRIVASHIAYTSERPEVLVEGVVISHEASAHAHHDDTLSDEDTTTLNSLAGYAQFAWRMNLWEHRLKPYTRVEIIRIDENDPLLQNSGDLHSITGGLRVDLHPRLALKTELTGQLDAPSGTGWDAVVQVNAAW